MIEDDARNLWCPMVRTSGITGANSVEGDFGANRGIGGLELKESLCIASGCMMWRGHLEPSVEEPAVGAISKCVEEGYCGLAGKP